MKKKGLNQSRLAEKTGLSRVHVNNLVRGRSGVSRDSAKRLARVLGIRLAEILEAPKRGGAA